MSINTDETGPDIFTVEGGVMVRAEGMNEPAFYAETDVTTVLDAEGDVWQRSPFNGRYFLPEEPWGEEPEDGDTTLAEIDQEYGIVDINVPLPEAPESETGEPAARYQRGDVTRNLLTGREALILSSVWHDVLHAHVYTVIEKGNPYPAGCSPVKGAATFPEDFLAPTTEPRFGEAEVQFLTLVYSL